MGHQQPTEGEKAQSVADRQIFTSNVLGWPREQGWTAFSDASKLGANEQNLDRLAALLAKTVGA